MTSLHYNVFIIGSGISGGGLAYPLARYTNIGSIGIADKADKIAAAASSAHGNSQTGHDGPNENYALEKALEAKRASERNFRFANQHGLLGRVMQPMQHLTIGVSESEIRLLLERYELLRQYYPGLEIFNNSALTELEPAVVFDARGKKRPEPILAIGRRAPHSAINFGALSMELIQQAQSTPGKTVDLHLNTKVKSIEQKGDVFQIRCAGHKTFTADFVVVNAGTHSLLMAHRMGYGLDLACLPIVGGFYMATGKILNGKVYTVQNPQLPMAALHGDPDLSNGLKTRFGPTAFFWPQLDPQFGISTFFDATRAMNLDWSVVQVLSALMRDPTIRHFFIENMLYQLPWIGKDRILEDLHKIVPALQEDDIHKAKGYGGIRAQIIDKQNKRLLLGDTSLHEGRVIFNMTPSPGATKGIDNGVRDARYIAAALGLELNEEKLEQELGTT